jgi:hypothetical protein
MVNIPLCAPIAQAQSHIAEQNTVREAIYEELHLDTEDEDKA